jgi:GDP-D-mannose 3', 5'-epimerase
LVERLLVTGAGGFIRHHLVRYAVANGYLGSGRRHQASSFEPSPAHEFEILDLRCAEACLAVTRDVSQIYHLADDMVIGHVTADCAKILRNNIVMAVHI